MNKKVAAIVAVCAVLVLSIGVLAGCSSSNSKSQSTSSSSKYKVVGELSTEHFGVGFKQGNQDVANVVTNTLLDMNKDGFVKTLCEKYAKQDISYDNWCLTESDRVANAKAPQGFKLIVGFDAEFPPYGYIGDDGKPTGFDLELAAEVAKRNNWEISLVAIDWDSKDALIDSGQITCIWNGFTYEGRESQYAFSGRYMKNSQVIVTKSDSKIAGKDDLKGKTVLTQSGSAAFELLQGDMSDLAKGFKELTAVPDYNTAFMSLDSGAADAIVCDSSVAKVHMS